jgi:hypothetical protein
MSSQFAGTEAVWRSGGNREAEQAARLRGATLVRNPQTQRDLDAIRELIVIPAPR